MNNPPNNPTIEPLLDSKQAAHLLGIGVRKMWSLQIGGDIPCLRIGRAVRFDPADLRRWIDRQKRKGGRR